jgi:hypothetical protein
MTRVEEYLLYAAQCRFMAECAFKADEQAEWRDLARLWLNRAMDSVEGEQAGQERPRHDPERARPGSDPEWTSVFGKDHAPSRN